MSECYKCGFWDFDREGCTCPSYDKWYACPIESEKARKQTGIRRVCKLEARRKEVEE